MSVKFRDANLIMKGFLGTGSSEIVRYSVVLFLCKPENNYFKDFLEDVYLQLKELKLVKEDKITFSEFFLLCERGLLSPAGN